VLPLKDHNPTSRPAVVTVVLIVINVAVFVLIQQRQADTEVVSTEIGTDVVVDGDLSFDLEYAAIPCEVSEGHPLTLEEIQATYLRGDDTACNTGDPATPELFPDKRVWLAIVTSMFLHAGWLHLGGNMLFLWIFGNNIEDHLGRLRYLAFYLLGGLAAAVAHIGVQPTSTVPVIGASGAIAAVMGAYLIWFPDARVRTLIFIVVADIRAKWLLAFWFVLQFFTSPEEGVAWVAHVGGFLYGAAIALLVRISGRGRSLVWRPAYRDQGWG
jgi:rhomboid family protein